MEKPKNSRSVEELYELIYERAATLVKLLEQENPDATKLKSLVEELKKIRESIKKEHGF